MNNIEKKTNKKNLNWVRFAISSIIALFISLLLAYFFQGNIYTEIVFILAIVFTFKLLGLRSINIFLYSIPYFIAASIFVFFKDYIMSYKLPHIVLSFINSVSFYALSFFILAFIIYVYEEKLERKINFRKKRLSYLFLSCIFGVLFIFLFINFNLEETDPKIIINNSKETINRIFHKEKYYSKKEFAIINGEKVKENIIISDNSAKKDVHISGRKMIKGWIIEANSIHDSEIDRIEFFLDGKPGEGKYLGKFLQDYNTEIETKIFIENLYINFYDRWPSSSEMEFQSINLEYQIMSYREVAEKIIRESGFMERNISNEDFLVRTSAGFLNRDWDGTWIDELEVSLFREDILYILINSEEFKKYSEIYYENISLKNNDLDIIRKDIREIYGEHYFLSGFSFEFDSTGFSDGEHTLYVYVRSPIFGWEYETINLIINNNNYSEFDDTMSIIIKNLDSISAE